MRAPMLAHLTMTALLGAALLVALALARPACAAEAVAPRVIVVSGEGEMSAPPDRAQLSAGVVSQAPTAGAALSANSTAMARVFAALKVAGIPENKVQTSNFSVSPQYPPYRNDTPQPRNIIGYEVSNRVSVTVDVLDKLGATLDALVRSGANDVGGVAFTIADPKPLAERARAAAVADAMAKARGLAAAAGVTLGPLLSLQEGGTSRPVPIMAMAKMAAQAAPPPIATGKSSVTANVTMTFAIQ